MIRYLNTVFSMLDCCMFAPWAPVYRSVDYALFEFCNVNVLHYRQFMEPSRTMTVAADFLNSFEMNNIDDK